MTTDRPVAARDSWARIDTGGPFAEIPWDASFSLQEFDRIRQGYIPEAMDDRWFLFFEEPNLFLLRSWTGYCIYRVTFAHSVENAVVRQSVVLANGDQYRRSTDEYEAAFLEFLVHRLLLGESWPMPDRPLETSPERRGFFRWLSQRLPVALMARLKHRR